MRMPTFLMFFLMLAAKIDERKKAADMKKRQEFQRLKSQMVTDLQVGGECQYTAG